MANHRHRGMPSGMVMPQVEQDYYPMKGGMDTQSPAISMYPGKCFDALNYTAEIAGGYRRLDGFERFDGRTAPSSANYWVMGITLSGAIANGDTVTGATSGATGKSLGIYGTSLILGRVTGTFVIGENLQVTAVTQAVSTTTCNKTGALTPSDDADYTLLAANDRRADIQAVPGSGRIRGLHVYNDILYAFRDNAPATAGAMYKQSAGGWTQVTFGRELQFTGATAEVLVGVTVTGATSGATGVVVKPMLRAGTWTVAGVGTLILSGVTGAFQNAENIQVGGVTKVVASGVDTAIARVVGGRVETITANFTGSTATEKMYGADGVNLAFEFDGTNYIPIRTGMTADTPTHIFEHKSHLFLSFLGSIQFSPIGTPYSWTVVLGAGEITTGSECTGFLMQTGSSGGASLLCFTKNKLFVLYGSSSTDFNMVPSNADIGFAAYTMQLMGNSAYGLTSRGIHEVATTLNYGDFDFDATSFPIQNLVASKLGLEVASTSIKAKNQYRIYFTDSSGIAITMAGNKVVGLMVLNYGLVVRSMTTQKLSTGEEVTYFGSDTGMVYRDNIGTSFDGSTLESYIRPAFNNLKSPRMRKRYRRATFEIKPEGYANVSVSYDLGYGTPAVLPSKTVSAPLTGSGDYWDHFTWDNFTWDAQVFVDPSISIEGTEKNISFFFYSNRAQDKPHTVQGVSLSFSQRRAER